MAKRTERPSREKLAEYAHLLLDHAAQEYAHDVLVAEGAFVLPMPGFEEEALEAWRAALRGGPEAPTPQAVRSIVDEALGKALVRNPLRHMPFVEEGRKTSLLRDFGKALHPERFAEIGDRTVREWVEHVVDLPDLPAGPTSDDTLVREHVEAMDPAERAREEMIIEHTVALRDLSPLAALTALRRLQVTLAGRLVEDLSPLAKLEALEELELDGARVVDLRPLASLKRLRVLKGSYPKVRDLSPLAGLTQLEVLSLSGGERIEDVSALASLRALREVNLDGTGVRDLSPLATLPALEKLSVSSDALTDFAPLARMTGLRELSLSSKSLRSAEVLRPLVRLTSLKLFDCPALEDASALDALTELEALDLSLTPLGGRGPVLRLPRLRTLTQYAEMRSPPPLDGLPALEELTVMCAELDTLAGLEHGRSLRKLSLGLSKTVKDLAPLAGLPALEELHLEGFEALEDLSPLASLTGLVRLDVDGANVSDLSPIAGMTRLTHLDVPRNAIVDVTPLARLTNLESLSLHQNYDLVSIRPLAACTKLASLDVEHCDKLRGPKNLADLRNAAKAPPPRKYPSAGVVPARPGQLVAFDARNHLPKQPPEGWTIPEREPEPDETGREVAYFMEAEELMVCATLWSRGEHHMLSVQIGAREGRPTDKQAARVLRRFRACEPFVETDDEHLHFEELPELRSFVAKAHPASPDSWGAVGQRRPFLRVEAPEEPGGAPAPRSEMADVRNHLPAPLPEGWSELPSDNPPDAVALLRTPFCDVVLWLRREENSDVHRLTAGLIPRPRSATIGDAAAVDVVSRVRARGAFQERSGGDLPQAPGMRVFVASPH